MTILIIAVHEIYNYSTKYLQFTISTFKISKLELVVPVKTSSYVTTLQHTNSRQATPYPAITFAAPGSFNSSPSLCSCI